MAEYRRLRDIVCIIPSKILEQRAQAPRLPAVSGTGAVPHFVAQDSAHFDFHARASFCASSTCKGVILAATKSRAKTARRFPSEAAKSNHMCALT
jgi:hypothetical protein